MSLKILLLTLKEKKTLWEQVQCWWLYNKPNAPDWYYSLRNYLRNFLLFNKLAWSWKCWESHFTIEVFSKLLEENAKCCRSGLNVKSERLYRRAMTMAGLLNRAYSYSVCNDKAYVYLSKKYPYKITGHRMELYSGADEKTKRLIAKISKRIDAKEVRMKEEAWKYVHKYIEHIWD